MKNELEHEHEHEHEIVKVNEAKTGVVDEVDAPSDAHAPGTPEKSIKSPPAMYWQRVRETHKNDDAVPPPTHMLRLHTFESVADRNHRLHFWFAP